MTECNNEKINRSSPVEFLDKLVGEVCATYEDNKGINHLHGFDIPCQQEVLEVIEELLEIVFPGFKGVRTYDMSTIRYSVGEMLSCLHKKFSRLIFKALHYNCKMENCKDCEVGELTAATTRALLEAIPRIREVMKKDIHAAYEGDPAAFSLDEIVVSYPGVKAITIQRFAHVLYHHKVPLIPRMMTEYAHSETGIDIHPGAHLDAGVFIDHGTGVVIGETAKLGDNVKIYQGVTLGALSFPKDACGQIIKGARRHPTIESDVTIYSGATVLGNITIGKGSIIGGNVWLTESVAPGSKITIQTPELRIKTPKQ